MDIKYKFASMHDQDEMFALPEIKSSFLQKLNPELPVSLNDLAKVPSKYPTNEKRFKKTRLDDAYTKHAIYQIMKQIKNINVIWDTDFSVRCPLCFEVEKDFVYHLKVHRDMLGIGCIICECKLTSLDKYEEHLERQHNFHFEKDMEKADFYVIDDYIRKSYKCDYCNRKFPSFLRYRVHTNTNCPKNPKKQTPNKQRKLDDLPTCSKDFKRGNKTKNISDDDFLGFTTDGSDLE